MKTILLITDGIGYSKESQGNAVHNAKTPNMDRVYATYPSTLVTTHGRAMGLPRGQIGNSEVGHMTMGAGRIIKHDLVRINEALDACEGGLDLGAKLGLGIESKLDSTPASDLGDLDRRLLPLCRCKNIHIIGLLSEGGVHSQQSMIERFIERIVGICKGLDKKDACLHSASSVKGTPKTHPKDTNPHLACDKNIYLHLISDGRDVEQISLLGYLERLRKNILDKYKSVSIATLSGRYYAMDRDLRYERVLRAYEAIYFSTPNSSLGVEEYVAKEYERGVYDEFIPPSSFASYPGIKDNDGIFMCNFRSDRMRELASLLSQKSFSAPYFSAFSVPEYDLCHKDTYVLTLTNYDERLANLSVLFNKPVLKDTLSSIIAAARLGQAHIAETEKYAHVTFFFNGGKEEALEGEERVLIPSPKVPTYDLMPEMSAYGVKDAVIAAIEAGTDFIVVNFANGDMVGHTGNLEAAIRAVEVVDACVGEILDAAALHEYATLLVSDHGNCEVMGIDVPNTAHTLSLVPCTLISTLPIEALKDGKALDAIAPSVLKLLGLEAKEGMSEALF